MPRRPRKQPRASGPYDGRKAPRPVSKAEGKIKKWVTRDDIEGNEEDQFHDRRDRILLGENPGDNDEDWEDGEEEVFGLGLEESDTEEGEGESDLVSEETLVKKKKNSKQTRSSKPKETSSSDESEEIESWGRKKSAYYSSNAGILALKEGEEDEDEANEMEEQEALKIQSRLREGMSDADFGLDNMADSNRLLSPSHSQFGLDSEIAEDEEVANLKLTNPLVLRGPTAISLDKATAIRRLEKTSPETLALAREWDDIANNLIQVQQRMEKQTDESPNHISIGLSHIHHQTLLSYVTNLAFYFHLRAAPPPLTNTAATRLKAVLERLLLLKQALMDMEDLDFDASSDDSDDSSSDISSLDEEERAELTRMFGSPSAVSGDKPIRHIQGSLSELDELLAEADAAVAAEEHPKLINGISDDTPTHKKSKSAKKEKKKKAKEPLGPNFDLVEPEFVFRKQADSNVDADLVEPFGEATSLSAADGADKKARKKSLRFHTNKIETSARRREERREKLGGDDDLPYRERKKEKEARIQKEIEKTRDQVGEDLDLDEAEDVSITAKKRKREEPEDTADAASGEEDNDGYYELVKRAKKAKKEAKKHAYDEVRMTERIYDNETREGPRSLTRAILKNRGLTPRRSKSIRNPRVKKREKYEKAKKKVRSQKAVYKGGLSGRPYGGEESGISKIVKSVKLI